MLQFVATNYKQAASSVGGVSSGDGDGPGHGSLSAAAGASGAVPSLSLADTGPLESLLPLVPPLPSAAPVQTCSPAPPGPLPPTVGLPGASISMSFRPPAPPPPPPPIPLWAQKDVSRTLAPVVVVSRWHNRHVSLAGYFDTRLRTGVSSTRYVGAVPVSSNVPSFVPVDSLLCSRCKLSVKHVPFCLLGEWLRCDRG